MHPGAKCRPRQKPHLTVIDVPGLFEVVDAGMSCTVACVGKDALILTSEGVTTELDKAQVKKMVRRYMENERTM